ncbi:MAG: hypothetical protein ACFE8N_02865 [Promethearchaeota archaeon]
MNVNNIKGRPKFSVGQILGYIIWRQTDGFHLRWLIEGKKPHKFTGKIVFQNKLNITKIVKPASKVKIYQLKNDVIQWETIEKDKINGLDFISSGTFTLELKIDKKLVKPKMIFLGPGMLNPEDNPFTIEQLTSEEALLFDKKEYERDIKEKLKDKPKGPLIEIEPEPIYNLVSRMQPIFESIPEPTPKPEPEPKPVYESIPKPEPEPKPVYESIPKPELKTEIPYESLPETKPAQIIDSPPYVAEYTEESKDQEESEEDSDLNDSSDY